MINLLAVGPWRPVFYGESRLRCQRLRTPFAFALRRRNNWPFSTCPRWLDDFLLFRQLTVLVEGRTSSNDCLPRKAAPVSQFFCAVIEIRWCNLSFLFWPCIYHSTPIRGNRRSIYIHTYMLCCGWVPREKNSFYTPVGSCRLHPFFCLFWTPALRSYLHFLKSFFCRRRSRFVAYACFIGKHVRKLVSSFPVFLPCFFFLLDFVGASSLLFIDGRINSSRHLSFRVRRKAICIYFPFKEIRLWINMIARTGVLRWEVPRFVLFFSSLSRLGT